MVSAPAILIVGAARGLGLAAAREFAAAGWAVIALDREPLALAEAAALGPGLLELASDPLVEAEAAVARLGDRPVEVALFCLPRLEIDTPSGLDARSDWEEVVAAMAWTPLRLAALIEPNLRAARRPVAAVLSDRVGSITLGAGTRDVMFRASLAALHQLWRTLSVEWSAWGCICPIFSLGSSDDPQVAAVGLRRLIEEATLDRGGQHLSLDGSSVPW